MISDKVDELLWRRDNTGWGFKTVTYKKDVTEENEKKLEELIP